jgi:hypothetical protein
VTSVWGRSAIDVLAGGASGTIVHFDGASWSPLDVGSLESLSVTGSPTGDAYAVSSTTVLRFSNEFPTARGGACARPVPIYCGGSLAYHGSNANQPAAFASYACGSRPATGSEVFYRLEDPVTGRLTVRLTPHRGDLDLLVLGARADGTCDPGACLAASQGAGTTVEELSFDAVAGTIYYFVVDAQQGVVSGYDLELSCQKVR